MRVTSVVPSLDNKRCSYFTRETDFTHFNQRCTYFMRETDSTHFALRVWIHLAWVNTLQVTLTRLSGVQICLLFSNSHGFSLRDAGILVTPQDLGHDAVQVSRELICLFMQTVSGFRSLSSPTYAVLVQCEIFCPSHFPFGDACIFPLSLSYDLCLCKISLPIT